MTDKEVAERAGWSVQRVVWMGTLPSWAEVSVGDMSAFMAACGLHPSTLRHHRRFLKRTLGAKNPLSRLRLAPNATLRLLAALPEANKEKIKAHSKAYREANKEKILARRRARYKAPNKRVTRPTMRLTI